ncbi:hypothetical protein E4V51_28855, partial [Paenibacillus sp. 28ISP30-2]|nr:hypothetical protein [Paenibacillus sp. 28ISP30-2]
MTVRTLYIRIQKKGRYHHLNTTLKLSQIVTNPNQPRKHFNEASLQELAASIVSDGLQESGRDH